MPSLAAFNQLLGVMDSTVLKYQTEALGNIPNARLSEENQALKQENMTLKSEQERGSNSVKEYCNQVEQLQETLAATQKMNESLEKRATKAENENDYLKSKPSFKGKTKAITEKEKVPDLNWTP
jgi:cell division protein FtsB